MCGGGFCVDSNNVQTVYMQGLRTATQVRTELSKLLDDNDQGVARLQKLGVQVDAWEGGEEAVMQMLNVDQNVSTDKSPAKPKSIVSDKQKCITHEFDKIDDKALDELLLPCIGRVRSYCDAHASAYYRKKRVVQCSMCRCYCGFSVVSCENAPTRMACLQHAATVFQGHPTSQLRVKALCNIDALKALRHELDVLIKIHSQVSAKS